MSLTNCLHFPGVKELYRLVICNVAFDTDCPLDVYENHGSDYDEKAENGDYPDKSHSLIVCRR